MNLEIILTQIETVRITLDILNLVVFQQKDITFRLSLNKFQTGNSVT